MSERQSRSLAGLLVVVFSFSLIGCEPQTPGSGGGYYPGEVDFDTFVDEYDELYHRALCEGHWECSEWERLREWTSTHYGQSQSARECIAGRQVAYSDFHFLGAKDSLEAGRVVFDGEAAADCLRAMRRSLKDELCGEIEAGQTIEAACEDVFSGTVGDGDFVLYGRECEDGTTGRAVSGECYGVCEKEEEIQTESCGDGPPCESHEYCSFFENECRPYGGPGDACSHSGHCQDLHYCHEEQCIAQRSRREGEDCSRNSHCARGLSCQGSSCKPANLAGEGEFCLVFDLPLCEPGLGCHVFSSDGVNFYAECRPLQPEGGICTWSNECQQGLYCDTDYEFEEEGQCAPRLELGEPCSRGDECESLRCEWLDPEGSRECIDEQPIWCELP